MLVWQRLLQAIDRQGKAAMATIVETRGSAPREAGARIVVLPDATFFGTIGGGTLEWRVIADLQAALARPNPHFYATQRVALGPELGQCCGGRVDLALEVFDRSRRAEVQELAEAEAAGLFRTRGSQMSDGKLHRSIDAGLHVPIGSAHIDHGVIVEGFGDDSRVLYLFGAGHVGRALVMALAPLPFRVVWVDPRPDAFPQHVPANVRCVQPQDTPAALDDAPADSFVLVMSHSHSLDLAIVARALKGHHFAYVGLIGSETKRARFTHQLDRAGLPKEDIQRMVTPIGVAGIHSKLPAAIAASVAADLLVRDEAMRQLLAHGTTGPAEPSALAMGGH
ncbi:xanthine dehydrogenase accessory protein XdhC [Kaistia nematophila]|uniref:Xanthine dehydrogenase accessory protein XdhC n=1 Tax=Kaistia nematophila TaxID=2994654 RepID=A0A9X3E107_9HYPH|nr:xanthine dehydrogenase accessory protein XdhC [Kaistia nematophila]MCX5568582.1 xanthine dehydrogenase accessory protein XdhC [Kaistia nematophila]